MGFERIVDLIADQTGVSREKVLELVRKKKEEMGGLVTDEGAALLVAVDLGVELRVGVRERVRIGELSDKMVFVPVVDGRVKSFLGVKRFEREGGGGSGTMASVIIFDGTGEVKLVLWGEHSRIVEKGQLRKGDIVRVVKGYVKRGLFGDLELHVGRFGRVVVNPPDVRVEEFPEVADELTPLSRLEPGIQDVTVEGDVVEVSPVTLFERSDGSKGRMAAARISDGERSVRVVFWDEQAVKGAQLRVGDRVRLVSGYTREGTSGDVEVHLAKAGRVEVVSRGEGAAERYTPVSQLRSGMSSVNVVVRVTAKTPLRTFTKPYDGSLGAVADIYVTDGTGWTRISLWDAHANLLSKINVGDLLRVRNAYTREDVFGLNLNAGRRAIIEVNPPDVPQDAVPPVKECVVKLRDLKPYMANISLDVKVKHVGEVRAFQRQDGAMSKMLTLVLEDETGENPAVAWGEAATKLEGIREGTKLRLNGCYSKLNAKGETEIHIGEGAGIEAKEE